MRVKNVVILGSTGSIGINALKVIRRHADRFKVVGLSAYNNFELLARQAKEFSPTHVAVGEKNSCSLKNVLGPVPVKVLNVNTDLCDLVTLKGVDVVVIGISGTVALEPFLSAVRHGKTVAPANKEALVIAGSLLMGEARRCRAQVIPVDSEQSAIFQCLHGNDRKELKKVYLTASGGPLAKIPQSRFDRLTVREVLNHPKWKMGRKITVDSATLMNKGFEVIEAKALFGLSVDQIEVVVHSEAVIHSMVSFRDGSILAQMGITDMRLPIQYALSFPERWETGLKQIDFSQLRQLTFAKPDFKKFPSLALAIDVAKKGGTLPAVLTAADEEAVDAFLKGHLRFSRIYDVVEKVVARHRANKECNLKDIWNADAWAREEAVRIMSKGTL